MKVKSRGTSKYLRVQRGGAILLLGTVLLSPRAPASSEAEVVLRRVERNLRLEGVEAVIQLTNYERDGVERVSRFSMAAKFFEEGQLEKRVYRFFEPAEIRGTGILVFDYEKRPDDLWVFLPALRKTRRIVSKERGKAFMGSEFSYADLTVPIWGEYDVVSAADAEAGGEMCSVVLLVPKLASTAALDGFARRQYWVSQTTAVVRRGLFFDARGAPRKELSTSDVTLVDKTKKRYRAMKMEMKNRETGRRSSFSIEKIAYAPQTKDEYFTTSYLERP